MKARSYEVIKKISLQKQKIILLEKMYETLKSINSYGQCGGFDTAIFNLLQEKYGEFLNIKNLTVSLRTLHKFFISRVEFHVVFIKIL